MASDASAPPLNKYLASTDKKTRDKAIKNLAEFLSHADSDALPKAEMAKLWKGIFYCYWMSDKPLVQQALSSQLADLLLAITSTSMTLAFLRGFWEAIVREWNGIDRLRMDKYYMLVRKFVNATFRWLARLEWDATACHEYNDMLTCKGGALCPEDTRVPASLSYHLCDIYLEELDKALALPSDSEHLLPAPLSTLLEPFLDLAARTSSTTTHQRIQSALLDPLFTALSLCSPSSVSPDEPPTRKRLRLTTPTYSHVMGNACLTQPRDEGAVSPDALKKALLRRFFDVASAPDTRDANRRRMYTVWKNIMAEDDEVVNGDPDGS